MGEGTEKSAFYTYQAPTVHQELKPVSRVTDGSKHVLIAIPNGRKIRMFKASGEANLFSENISSNRASRLFSKDEDWLTARDPSKAALGI